MKKIRIIAILVILILVVSAFSILFFHKEDTELKAIKSQDELLKFYEGEKGMEAKDYLLGITFMPFFATIKVLGMSTLSVNIPQYDQQESSSSLGLIQGNITIDTTTTGGVSTNLVTPQKNYSTTNIQVENVDEADINKTDGDYIYSISETDVVITDVKNPADIKVAATIPSNMGQIPEDLILYQDKLIIIYVGLTGKNMSSNNKDTIVSIYDISDREKPIEVKTYRLYEPYYTSRCIDNQLYVISTGKLRKENDKIVTYYEEGYTKKDIGLKNIRYLEDLKTNQQTLISSIDLNNLEGDVSVSSYLMDISNAYVSEDSIYLLDEVSNRKKRTLPVRAIYGPKGILGLYDYEIEEDLGGIRTKIYQFGIEKDGKVNYKNKTEIKGKTINQYSLDEKDGHLRIALYDEEGARVAVFDENLNQIGISDFLAKGERMYSSRFMGDKAYLVTYRTVDPLFVIDLSDESNPTVLGELKIPGYSTYLHPYDENHLIGIGMETEEVIHRDSSGKVISTTSQIIGMKMALFDVSDVKNPTQIASTVIGDRRTTSAILTNPKALLFSKEKGLIAIPVNNYKEDFEVSRTSDSVASVIESYTNYYKGYLSEGYLVYDISLEEGFTLKGKIVHEPESEKTYRPSSTKLLRGLYIEDYLYTVSEVAIKVNDLKTLELVDELKLN